MRKTIRFIPVSILVCLVPGVALADPTDLTSEGPGPVQIINGQNADPGEYPWIVSLQAASDVAGPDSHVCGGALIAPQWVLTAAHCVVWDGFTPNLPSTIEVVVGGYDLTVDTTRVAIDRVLAHAGYDSNNIDNDIALVHLVEPATIASLPGLVDASMLDIAGAGVSAMAIGWGYTDNISSQTPPILQELPLPIVDDLLCEEQFGEARPNNICIGLETAGQGICYGDSGSPLLVQDANGQWRSAGIASFIMNPECGELPPYDFYTRVSQYTEWVASCQADPDNCFALVPPPPFSCDDGSEIPEFWVCDGWFDCPDGSDETVEGCETPPPFFCDDGSALPGNWQCDDFPDCTGGEDEVNCGTERIIDVVEEAPGENCEAGGQQIRIGIDINENGMLDEEEVASRHYVCNGVDGQDGQDGEDGQDGADGSRVEFNDEPPGANCGLGGTRVDVGVDVNRNGALEPEEIEDTVYVCGVGAGGGCNVTNDRVPPLTLGLLALFGVVARRRRSNASVRES